MGGGELYFDDDLRLTTVARGHRGAAGKEAEGGLDGNGASEEAEEDCDDDDDSEEEDGDESMGGSDQGEGTPAQSHSSKSLGKRSSAAPKFSFQSKF